MLRPEIFLLSFSTLITKLFWSILLLLATPLWAANIKLLAFGDSITAGYRLSPSEAYPAQLEKIMKAQNFDVTVSNAGVSGDTSAQGLRRLDWSTQGIHYDWVLLCLGANDGLRQLPVAQMKKNLETLIKKIQAKKSKVLLMGMKLPLNYSASYRQQFEAVYPALAKKYKLAFLPFILENVALVSALTLEDQIHPNAQGHQVIAKNLWKILAAKL